MNVGFIYIFFADRESDYAKGLFLLVDSIKAGCTNTLHKRDNRATYYDNLEWKNVLNVQFYRASVGYW